MDRRDFLYSGALGSLVLLRGNTVTAAPSPAPRPAPAPSSWESVRAEFDRAAPDRIHMSSFFLVSHPRAVREAIEGFRTALDANPLDYIETNVAKHEIAVRAAAASYIGAKPDEIAMTGSTTQGISIVYSGWDLKPNQEILSTTHDHIVTQMAVDNRAARNGGKVRRIALYDDPAKANADEIAARLAKALKPETRVVAVTWVHSGTGVKLPIKRLADVIAKANAKRSAADRMFLCVDGVHGFGNQDVDLSALGCDFFMTGCHKWTFGPRGTGLVWARPDAWPNTQPTIVTMDPFWRTGPVDKMPYPALMTPGGFHSFEHRWAVAAAFEMCQRIGRAKIAARIRELNTRCKQGLAKLKKVKLVTPMSPELSAGIICFEVDGLTPKQVVERLGEKQVIASVTPSFYAPAYARVAPSLLTLEADVDRTVAAIASL